MDNQKLDIDRLKVWSEENGYEITFATPLPKLKALFYNAFGDVVVTESVNRDDELSILIEEVKKSDLPDTLKKWVIENPEKFKDNIEEVKKLLKK